jgi:hypothetical protein
VRAASFVCVPRSLQARRGEGGPAPTAPTDGAPPVLGPGLAAAAAAAADDDDDDDPSL